MDPITDLRIIYGKAATAPFHYTIIPADLNSGARGEYIWLAYSQHIKNGAPITGIQVSSSKKKNDVTSIPPGYTKVEGDLNRGAGGRYIYLSYTRDPSRPPITAVDVIVGTKDWIAPREGFVRINQDCNEDAKGNFVYICYMQGPPPSNDKANDAITDLRIVYGETAIAPPGYTIVPADLNSGARGEYEWLAYSKNPENGAPITGIKVIASDESNDPDSIPSGYIKVEGDLNRGARGKYIYLCYTRRSSKPPITAVDVIIGTKNWIAPREGFTRINQDCNEGARGNYVFICYK